MSAKPSASKRWFAPLAAAAALGVGIVGIALGSNSDAEDRSTPVPIEHLGISVPAGLTEQLDLGNAIHVGDAYRDLAVFHASGRGEYAGNQCIFTALPAGGSDVVPFVCDTADVLRATGLDIGESTADGGLEGVLVRGALNDRLNAETYKVGPQGGRVVLSPGPGDDVVLDIPNLAELDVRAERDAQAFQQSLNSYIP